MKNNFDINEELESNEYKQEWNRHIEMRNNFVYCLKFCIMDSSRSPNAKHNFFIRLSDDILQSIIPISTLAEQGVRNTCRRELRYLIELAIKSCYISQQAKDIAFEEQISEYEALLKAPSITPINDIELYFLKANSMDLDFKSEVKRAYGLMSNYVHSTPKQILERLALADAGRYIGFEGIEELKVLNDEVEFVYSYVLVLLMHSIPQWVVGDYFVEPSGHSVKWSFSGSKYLARIDECFDYKHERQDKLEVIREIRNANIRY
jgi:hypothetical protein